MRELVIEKLNFLQNNFGDNQFAEPYTNKCLEENKSVLLKLVEDNKLNNYFSAFFN